MDAMFTERVSHLKIGEANCGRITKLASETAVARHVEEASALEPLWPSVGGTPL